MAAQQHALAAEGVAERAVEQHGDGHGQHIGAQRLLHGRRAHGKFLGDGVERGQVGVDAQWTDHGAQGKQQGQGDGRFHAAATGTGTTAGLGALE
jgi:hypothetical protein